MVTHQQSLFLRQLAIGDAGAVARLLELRPPAGDAADQRTGHLVRIGALVAIGAETPAYQREVNEARAAGATTEEIVAVLRWLGPMVGSTHLMSAAPRLALALGYDVEMALEAMDPDAH